MNLEFPVWYVIISVALGIAVSYSGYKKYLKTSPSLYLAAFLRFLSLFITLLAIGLLSFDSVENLKELPRIVLAVDNSSSMGKSTSVEQVDKIISELELSVSLKGVDSLNIVLFGDKINADSLNFNQKYSNFEKLHSELQDNYQQGDILILLSDMRLNQGRFASFDFYGNNFFSISTRKKSDLNAIRIQKIICSERVKSNSAFPVEIFINRNSMQGYRLQILDQNGAELISYANFEKSIDRGVKRIYLKSDSLGLGLRHFTVNICDSLKVLSSKKFSVEFVDQKNSALIYYRRVDPNISFFSRALKENNYSVILSDSLVKPSDNTKFVVNLSSENLPFNLPEIRISNLENVINANAERLNAGGFYYFIGGDSKIYLLDSQPWKKALLSTGADESSKIRLSAIFNRAIELSKGINYYIEMKSLYSLNELIELSVIPSPVEYRSNLRLMVDNTQQELLWNSNFYSSQLPYLSEGLHTVKLLEGDKLIKSKEFKVENIDLESVENETEDNYFEFIRSQSTMYPVDSLPQLLHQLHSAIAAKPTRVVKTTDLYSSLYFISFLIIFLSVEWVIRRLNNLY